MIFCSLYISFKKKNLFHLWAKLGVFSVFSQGKTVYFTDFHLAIKAFLLVVREWHTHENKGICLCFQTMIVKKYLHTQTQPHTLQKAHSFLNIYTSSAPSIKCVSVPVCVQILFDNHGLKVQTRTFIFMGISNTYTIIQIF